MKTNTDSILDRALKEKNQPAIEMFSFTKHGVGAAGVAAKRIATGEIVSFDIWMRIKDQNGFTVSSRQFIKTVYIGLAKLEDEKPERNTALRMSNTHDLLAVNTFSLLASWDGNEISTDPVFISAAIAHYMGIYNYDYFLNE